MFLYQGVHKADWALSYDYRRAIHVPVKSSVTFIVVTQLDFSPMFTLYS